MSERSDDSEDYEIGYGRPPKQTRFKPGQSGNPKGRPRGRKNVHTILEETLYRPVTITEGTNFLAGTDPASVRAHIEQALAARLTGRVPRFWDGQAAGRIAEHLAGTFAAGGG